MDKKPLNQYVFLEGPSCSGKTTALKAISSADVAKIYKQWPADIKNPTTEFFLERDEDKLRRARATPEFLKVVDRSYLSTLTFYAVLDEQEGISAAPVYRWFINEMGNTLYRPDGYIFFDVPAEVSIKRAEDGQRKIDKNNMWLRFPDRINYWYGKLLAVLEPSTQIYRIDATRSPDQVKDDLENVLQIVMHNSYE